jgi:N-methylhydantoinase B/oxoprolinase/acetone carboxylase alpha subunit
LTVNRTAIEQNEARKRLSSSLNTKAEDINNMKTQIAGLNQDLSEIKQMLKQLMLREN